MLGPDLPALVAADIATIDELLPCGSTSLDDAPRIDLDAGDAGDAGAASAFDVDRVLASSALHAITATDRVGWRRGLEATHRTVELAHVLATSTTHVEVDGVAPPAWADLSGVYPTADGRHLQIHCNFPHHARGVCELLGTGADRDDVAAAIARRDAVELESALIAADMVGAFVRTIDEWDAHPHAAATRGLPLVSVEQIGDAEPLPLTAVRDDALDGLRVLDCSRVLAGPVAAAMLAARGADVLRVGASHLPSVEVGVLSTGFGKRNADVDLRTAGGVETMTDLLGSADVWIDAYRPGALAGFGFDHERAATVRPGVVIVQLSAFDTVGPWAGRRGFDSIVQSTTGVRWAGGEMAVGPDGAPLRLGPQGLPVQALDYATGFLAAGVAARMVEHQWRVGGSWLVRLSLLRTRNWLTSMGGPSPYQPGPVTVSDRHLATIDSPFGAVTAVTPLAGRWTSPPMPLGSSAPTWRQR